MSETGSSDKFFKENEILHLFKFIDSNNNMTIEKHELEVAFKKIQILMGFSIILTMIRKTL